jgi:hypothetical protein
MYWYKVNGRLAHVVFASHASIARWYARTSPFMRGATFVEKRNRAAQGHESTTILAHAADKTLRDSLEASIANGASPDYIAQLKSLARHLPCDVSS